jgi:hypothetical protein
LAYLSEVLEAVERSFELERVEGRIPIDLSGATEQLLRERELVGVHSLRSKQVVEENNKACKGLRVTWSPCQPLLERYLVRRLRIPRAKELLGRRGVKESYTA